MFAAKALTVLLAVVIILLVIASLKGRQRKGEGALTVTRLNDQLARMTERLSHAVLDKPAFEALQKTRQQEQQHRDRGATEREKAVVLDVHEQSKPGPRHKLRDDDTAVLHLPTPQDEVIDKQES